MKKLFNTFVVCALMLFALCVTASAEKSGYYTYTVSDGEATISKVSESISGDITIPSTLGGYPVTSIGDSAFDGCGDLTSVVIPDSVTSIGEDAFCDCGNLANVVIPNSVTTIGSWAFGRCFLLTSITIPKSVTTINERAFDCCPDLTNINVSEDNNYYSSENGVLFNKDKTTLVRYPEGKNDVHYTIPASVTTIGNGAFRIPDRTVSWSKLTSIIISDNVTTIGDNAFYACRNLTSIVIPDGVTTIGNKAFFYCDSLKSLVIGDEVTTIGYLAFYRCKGLTSVEIPCSVTTIGDYAFEDCDKLTSITVSENNNNYCSENGVLFNKDRTALIQYPAGKTDVSYVIPDTVTTIGEEAFYKCNGLTSVVIGDGVTTIGDFAFDSCNSLTNVKIPDSVTTIGDLAFYSCDGLTSVVIGDGVTTIGEYAFYGCADLTNVYYKGTSEQWGRISIGYENDNLINANIIYNEKIMIPADKFKADCLNILIYNGKVQIVEDVQDLTITMPSTVSSYKILYLEGLNSLKPLCSPIIKEF